MSEYTTEQMLPVRLTAISDLARLASSTSALGHVTYIVHFERGGKHYYGVFVVFRDYYKLYGLPMFYYVELDKELPGNYLLFRSDEAGEVVEISRGTKPGWIALPIVNLAPENPQFHKLLPML